VDNSEEGREGGKEGRRGRYLKARLFRSIFDSDIGLDDKGILAGEGGKEKGKEGGKEKGKGGRRGGKKEMDKRRFFCRAKIAVLPFPPSLPPSLPFSPPPSLPPSLPTCTSPTSQKS